MQLHRLKNSGHVIVGRKLSKTRSYPIESVILLMILFSLFVNIKSEEQCKLPNSDGEEYCSLPSDQERTKWTEKTSKRYVLYDINRGEGFNLRRDVYLRIAGLVRKLILQDPMVQWILVLPPWGPLYHWRSEGCGSQTKITWSHFFDLNSMGYYVPVIEFIDFLKQRGKQIDMVYYLQHDDWEEGTEFKDKLLIEECKEPPKYVKSNGVYRGTFWGYGDVFASEFKCVTVQGHASSLKHLLSESLGSVLLDRAETVLHDSFGDADYWAARRSMRFSKRLCSIADQFRKKYLNSNDENDRTVLHSDWRSMKVKHGLAVGGPYIGVHLRRKDFVQSRNQDVPSLEYAAEQIRDKQKLLGFDRVFIATDAPEEEYAWLKELLPDAVRFVPDEAMLDEIKDGGVAIVDQWICAHAAYFIGSFESTFSFRIQEEREILGFNSSTTFNRLCGNGQKTCQQPSNWKIVY